MMRSPKIRWRLAAQGISRFTLSFAVVAVGIALTPGCARSRNSGAEGARVITVDQLAGHPEKYSGPVVVTGTVAQADSASGMFALGCGDACLSLPVQFHGPLPPLGSQVDVSGSVAKTVDGRYILQAREVKPK